MFPRPEGGNCLLVENEKLVRAAWTSGAALYFRFCGQEYRAFEPLVIFFKPSV